MNEHLKPVFENILPALERAGISYWIIGGVAAAIINGAYFRRNRDLDVIIPEKYYDSAVRVIKKVCQNMNWQAELSYLPESKRPKLEVMNSADEFFSAIPVYFSGHKGKIIFKYENEITFPLSSFSEDKTDFEGYRVQSLPEDDVKRLFKFHLEHLFSKCQSREAAKKYMKNEKNMLAWGIKYQRDAKILFGSDDLLGLVGF